MRTVRYRIVIAGRVQGVYFRESARREAVDLGVLGWVRNLADGKVEAVAEGPQRAVQAFISWCRRGPETSHVDFVETSRQEPTGEFADFRVMH